MRLTVTVPDNVAREVKKRADNVSAFVTEALVEHLYRIMRREARGRIRRLAGSASIESSAYEALHQERRSRDRS